MNDALVNALAELYRSKGAARYGLESISQLQHALQSATLAEAAGESPRMIAAALLHDIGHMLSKLGENPAEEGIDNRHEAIGAAWLRKNVGEELAAPVRLHVAAKRYLCATEPGYAAQLAPDSVTSLALQGGPMREDEIADFLKDPAAQDAIRLRRIDDEAKDPNARTPDFAHFLRYLRD